MNMLQTRMNFNPAFYNKPLWPFDYEFINCILMPIESDVNPYALAELQRRKYAKEYPNKEILTKVSELTTSTHYRYIIRFYREK